LLRSRLYHARPHHNARLASTAFVQRPLLLRNGSLLVAGIFWYSGRRIAGSSAAPHVTPPLSEKNTIKVLSATPACLFGDHLRHPLLARGPPGLRSLL
ncbi:MAG: hypothetical protein M1541_18725, partial [Acidobacteria bacterium]|nr:hypothetical protein [Acidobacteriota bacterium]